MLRNGRGMRRTLLAGVLVLGSAGCTRIDDALASVPFLAFMRSSPAFDPYEATRPAPPGSVPFESPAGELVPAIATAPLGADFRGTEQGLRAFAAGEYGQNPFVGEDLQPLGRTMYDRHCAVCHGVTGAGDGPVVARPGEDRYPPIARSLLLEAAVGLPDGYIYGIIRVGRGLMPAYGGRITHRERWAIVEYVRTLQRQSGATPAQAPVAAPQNPTGGE
jgi:mono/diheme cytochrome c family protein